MAHLARSPLKVILFGEHAVLSGERCLAVAVDVYGYLTIESSKSTEAVAVDAEGNYMDLFEKWRYAIPGFRLTLSLDAALGCGLGTSAAISLLLSYAKARSPDILEEALEMENAFHGKASGVDVMACYTGGLISFRKGVVERLSIHHLSQFKILIFNTRIPKNTESAIRLGRRKKELYGEIGKVSEEAYKLLQREFTLEELYRLIRKNQDLLDELGVCPREIKDIIDKMREIGIEAKITGAGCGGHLLTVVKKEQEIPGWTSVSIDLNGFHAFDVWK
ncbi:mevalonate kinase [Encephalitozoon hellem ATCC 50504]|uniref:Mevalonate kinase n=1 Tax=Encephalitozoon hellem TaxID=27973 RepID=A0A9Q9C2W6_ENCHE|nr:mevalonate kinase [Encephalitozoon hellem ATCC 50504]AFM99074.1 mevalonate kinase [Encephalitozoon hellem ATCC 50504]UTX42480.1 mevalonate kinase [Encephalitozoon hellem]WEL37926.1 mevalonate kinase [Encephalitozoon hellem]|eukprot:XP_003888055.1 mevalonate kinase [Encephalitozoon hellem ATCC 50504]